MTQNAQSDAMYMRARAERQGRLIRMALEDLVTATTDHILAVDKLMSGPPAPIRGNKLAVLISNLQNHCDIAREALAAQEVS